MASITAVRADVRLTLRADLALPLPSEVEANAAVGWEAGQAGHRLVGRSGQRGVNSCSAPTAMDAFCTMRSDGSCYSNNGCKSCVRKDFDDVELCDCAD